MSLCEVCRADIDGVTDPLPPELAALRENRSPGDHGATPLAWEIVTILWRRRNRGAVSKDTLMTLLYADRPDDPPAEKILDVYVCRLRSLLKGLPWAITNAYGEGFRLVPCDPVASAAAAIAVGVVEEGVPPPSALRRRGPADTYGFKGLSPGQSREVLNSNLLKAKAACHAARKRGLGTFQAGHDSEGKLRIWRLE